MTTATTTTTTTLSGLPALTGQPLGVSDWVDVTQQRINGFADATDDHQWIHVDAARAAVESPFGELVAHGYLTLSLLVPLWTQILTVTDARLVINYGLSKVRFPAPVPTGSRIRLAASLIEVVPVSGGCQVTLAAMVEREGRDKPACIAEPILRFLGDQG
jgi:acyl dehydratase